MKLFLPEPETRALRAFLAGPTRLVSSEIVRVELLRALRRARVREEVTTEANVYLATLRLLRLEAGALERAARIGPTELRTLDAVHLATALEFSRVPVTFLCYDQRLAAAAREHGLAVVTPGLDEVHEP